MLTFVKSENGGEGWVRLHQLTKLR